MLDTILHELRQAALPIEKRKATFFKTGPGDYAEHDQFLGVPTPRLREIAKRYRELSLAMITNLLQSPINEERLLALMMLVERYQKGNQSTQEDIFQLYLAHIRHINNWNLVDASAHHIVGAHLYTQDKSVLLALASSSVLWHRRIAIVSTWYFIRHNDYTWTIKIAETLLADQEDLIHKAVGWMLREMGKRHIMYLIDFLNTYASQMPRTMLRYAIEKLPCETRKDYLTR